jgi:hypothetical protein
MLMVPDWIDRTAYVVAVEQVGAGSGPPRLRVAPERRRTILRQPVR